MSDARREQDDEPLTQLDVDIDTRNLDSLVEGDATSPGTAPPRTDQDGADGEPQTLQPPRVMGVPRLRAHTIMGVAPPSSGASGPPTTEPQESAIPKIVVEGDDEQTTMVGKLLASAQAQAAQRLKGEPKEQDLYSDETATTVGDAEKLIATASAASLTKHAAVEGDEPDEPTESRSVKDALMEDVTSKRDAINIDSALAKAAELRAEAEARKKRAMKKRTIHGLGDGPLTFPERPKGDDEIPTFENKLPDTGERPAGSVPADSEMETLSGGAPQPAPMRSINTEPETIQVPVPSTPRGRLATEPPPAQQQQLAPQQQQQPPHEAFQQTLNVPPGGSPYTQPMPYAPAARTDDGNGIDPLRATMQAVPGATGPGRHPPSGAHLAMSPQGGVPHFHSPQMPVHAPGQYSMQPHSGPAAFARTAAATHSEALDAPPKKSRAGLVFFLFLLIGLGGVAFWQRATLRALWIAYRHPFPPAQASAAPSASPPPSIATAPPTPPPVATESPAPHGSSSAAPHASASASASASPKTQAKKPPPWKPPPPKSRPTNVGPKPAPPKPVDDSRGF